MSVELAKATFPRLVAFLLEYQEESNQHRLAELLMEEFSIRQHSSIEIHNDSGTHAIYRHGDLVGEFQKKDVLPWLVNELDVLFVKDSYTRMEDEITVHPTLQGLYADQAAAHQRELDAVRVERDRRIVQATAQIDAEMKERQEQIDARFQTT